MNSVASLAVCVRQTRTAVAAVAVAVAAVAAAADDDEASITKRARTEGSACTVYIFYICFSSRTISCC